MRSCVRALVVGVCVALTGGAPAMAESFQVAGTFASGGTFSGLIAVDNTALTVDAVSLAVDAQGLDGVMPASATGNFVAGLDAWEIAWVAFPHGSSGPESALDLLIPLSATESELGGAVCAVETVCSFGAYSELRYALSSADPLSMGTVTPTAVTPTADAPEPSTLALVGTGVLSVGGVLRRRLSRG